MRARVAHAYRAVRAVPADALRRWPASRVGLPAAFVGVLIIAAAAYGAGNLGGGPVRQAGVTQVRSEATPRPTPAPTATATPSPAATPEATPAPSPIETSTPAPDPAPAPAPEPPPEPAPEPAPAVIVPPSGPPCGSPPYLTWVWRFSSDGPAQQIASTLAANRGAVILKTHDGTDWMSTYDPAADAVTGPGQVAKLAAYFEANGVPFHAWAVVKGVDPIKEAQMAADTLAAGARSLYLDLEPWQAFWQGTPDSARVFGAELRRLQPDATIVTVVDARPWTLNHVPLAEFASFSNAIAPLVYWQTFDSPENRQGYAQAGWPPPPGEMTPEFVLDVSAAALQRYGLGVRPVGQGSSDQARWTRFLDHATAIGMPELSVWRYGVVRPDVWSLLGERTPSGQAYTVQPGDTLSRIGQAWGVDVTRIAIANRLADPNFLSIGQVLCIPLG